jgi:ubiquinone/menaquinone biosynthesis C-methylase UbiE
MSEFDLVAAEFERHRALPDAVPGQIREAVRAIVSPSVLNVLDLGAGSGRLGRAFIAARDRYVGVDTSYAMLDRFRLTTQSANDSHPSLVQADGCFLPFRDDTFSAVMLAHVLSASPNWRDLLAETCRVLEPNGFLILAQRVGPTNGIDAQLRKQLRTILTGMSIELPEPGQVKTDARTWLMSIARSKQHLVAARWKSDTAPRDFLKRHATGVRFAALPSDVQKESMQRLSEWAVEKFGSLDASFAEEYDFELDAYQF